MRLRRLQLQRGLAHWREVFLGPAAEYHTIVKFRTDLELPPQFRFAECIGRRAGGGVGIVYALSDLMFYASPDVFYAVFPSLLSAMVSTYCGDTATPQQLARFQRVVAGLPAFCLPRELYFAEGGGKAAHHESGRAETGVDVHGRALTCGCRFPVPPSNSALKSSTHASGSPPARACHALPWRLTGGGAGARSCQSEPALSFHIFAQGAVCLPLDVPHRGMFQLLEDHKLLSFNPG